MINNSISVDNYFGSIVRINNNKIVIQGGDNLYIYNIDSEELNMFYSLDTPSSSIEIYSNIILFSYQNVVNLVDINNLDDMDFKSIEVQMKI